jgi:hypothetical protein
MLRMRDRDHSWIEFRTNDSEPVNAFDFLNHGMHTDWNNTQ